MANQYYQFAFTFSSIAMTTTFQQSGNSAWQNYVEPNYNGNSNRAGGPGPGQGQGSYLVVSPSDTVFINLKGPAGWTWPTGSQLQVILSPANWPNANQGFSPASVVYVALNGTMQADNVTMQFQLPALSQVTQGPNYYRYEITIAFGAIAAETTTVVYFSDDPEMDVMGN